jgi:hypothetical protein
MILGPDISTIENDWKKESRNYEEKCLQAFEQKCGIKGIELSAEDQKTLKQASLKVQEKLAGRFSPRDLMNDIVKALEEYRRFQTAGLFEKGNRDNQVEKQKKES